MINAQLLNGSVLKRKCHLSKHSSVLSCANLFSTYQCTDLMGVSGSTFKLQQMKSALADPYSPKLPLVLVRALPESEMQDQTKQENKWNIWAKECIFLLLRTPQCGFESYTETFLEFLWLFSRKSITKQHFFHFLKIHFSSLPLLSLMKTFQASVLWFERQSKELLF